MLHDSTKTLILKLCEMTARGDIAWREGERQCSVFETEGYTVEVESDPPTVRVTNADGRELERAGGNELSTEPWPDGDGDYGSHVAQMADRAHRVARGAERAIATILTALSAAPKAEPKQAAPKPEAAPAPAEVVAPSVAAVAENAAAIAAKEAEMLQGKPPEPVIAPPAPVAQAAPPAPPQPSAPVYVLDPNQRPQPADGRVMFGAIASFSQPVKREPRLRPKVAAPAPPAPQRFSMSAVTRQTVRGEEVRNDAAPSASADAYKLR